MKPGLMLVVFMCTTIRFFAQDATQKGKIYTSDTIYSGYISSNNIEETPQSFQFRSDMNTRFMETRGAINKVVFDNGIVYQKFGVKLSILQPDYMERRSWDYDSAKYQQFFLQLLVSGKVSLYQLRDQYGHLHFFYQKEGENNVTVLVNKPYVDAASRFVPDVAYRNQLLSLARTYCSSFNIEESSIVWKSSAMIDLFRKINDCGGEQKAEDHFTNQSKWTYDISLLAGVLSVYINPNNTAEIWKRKISPVVGFSLLTYPKNNRRNFAIGIDLFYLKFKNASDTLSQYGARYQNFYEASHFVFRPFMRFYFSDGSIMPYADLGASVAALGKSRISSNYPWGGKDPYELGMRIRPVAALGIKTGRFSVQLNYSNSFGSPAVYNDYGVTARYTIW